ncbi:Metallo-dependent phosphatase-like protein [Lipomyces japonicus]|uniref:Metallo-dependent phosphatase-like protein n=1 Tax=Lipomyces japonicus TaxID=56871 RepID=UPI0034CF7592
MVFSALKCLVLAGLLLNLVRGEQQDSFVFQQPDSAPPPRTLPLRKIEWGNLNFISTTDTHGWLAGHLLQPSYAADWGDYASFIEHIKAEADERGVDVIVVDDGDQHDGNGLSDATFVNGDVSQQILIMAPIDLMSIGNHELYKCEVTQQTYDRLAPHFDGRYLTSNVEIQLDNGTWVHIGKRSYRFTTKNQKINIMAFGFLFDFKLNCDNSRVSEVEDVVQQAWFQSAIREPGIDMFLVFGHYPIRFWPEMWAIHSAIRAVHKNIPIQYFGGHSHIRDFVVLDSHATALQAGRFLETIGWLSINGIEPATTESVKSSKPLQYSRRYIDFNPHSLAFHANKSLGPVKTFGTPRGNEISSIIHDYRIKLNLTYPFGCVPRDYLLEKAKYPGPNSLLTLLEEHVLQDLVPDDNSLSDNSRLIFINSGSLRYDMYGGVFTVDQGYIVSPFDNEWKYFPKMPYAIAKRILSKLNALDYIFMKELTTPISRTMTIRRQNLGDAFEMDLMPTLISAAASQDVDYEDLKTTGYVTIDDYGLDGDDTPHKPYPLYYLPNAVATEDKFPASADPEMTDVVFLDFMQPFILDALADLDPNTKREDWLIKSYGGKAMKELIKDYVLREWGTDCL